MSAMLKKYQQVIAFSPSNVVRAEVCRYCNVLSVCATIKPRSAKSAALRPRLSTPCECTARVATKLWGGPISFRLQKSQPRHTCSTETNNRRAELENLTPAAIVVSHAGMCGQYVSSFSLVPKHAGTQA